MMTVVAIMAGLVPIFWTPHGVGGDATDRRADDRGHGPSTLLTLIVIPAIYALVKGWRLPKGVEAASANATAVEPAGFGVAAE